MKSIDLSKSVNQENSRKLHSFNPNMLESCRDALLQYINSPTTLIKIRQRDVIKALLPEIRAGRERGVSFECLADLLRPYGLNLNADTIREYFYEELPESDRIDLRNTAYRYKKAAQEAIQQFRATSNGESLETVIKNAIDKEAKKSIHLKS